MIVFLWGLWNDIDHAGLSVALAYSGRPATAAGFATTTLLRYVPVTCDAVAALRRIPLHMDDSAVLADVSEYTESVQSPERETNEEPIPPPGKADCFFAAGIDWQHLALEQASNPGRDGTLTLPLPKPNAERTKTSFYPTRWRDSAFRHDNVNAILVLCNARL